MSLAAAMQITDQDIYQQATVIGAENLSQTATTPNGKTFAYAQAGGTNLTAGKIVSPASVTANYATRTLSVAVAQYASQITVTLGTTVAADAFKGFWLVVTDGTGKGQGTYYVTGNTAATAGNSNVTVATIDGAFNIALDTTSVVGFYPNQQSALVVSPLASAPAVPVSGAPVINITAANFFWNQTGGYASILSDGAITKNAGAIPSDATDGAVEIEVTGTVTRRVGYAPELTVTTKYSPLVLTLDC